MTVTETVPELAPERLGQATERALAWLDSDQRPEGFWLGRLLSSSTMEAEWVFLQHVLGFSTTGSGADPKLAGVLRAIEHERREDGSWAVFHGAPEGELSSTVECYVALKLGGVPADDPHMVKSRNWILSQGGLARLRNFTKFWLALLGEWSWDDTPALPPEFVFLPQWFPISTYRFASWARATIVPLAVLSARRHVVPLAPEQRLDELFPEGRDRPEFRLPRKQGLGWHTLFHVADRGLRLYERLGAQVGTTPGRETAIKLCLEWLLRRQERDGAWSGIQPPWVWGLMALHREGYSLEHPVLKAGLEAFDPPWAWEVEDRIYVQASNSPVWDTALAALGYLDAGRGPGDPILERAIAWLLREQITEHWGDWQFNAPATVKPGGWAFEFANACYPDVDDTAVVLIVLERYRRALVQSGAQPELQRRLLKAIDQGEAWMIGMQSSNGGWAAFDRDNDTEIVTKIPFADFGELLDPPSVDVTGHVLEALALLGKQVGHPVVDKAVAWVLSEQEPEGSWFGRWGCNHVYGTGAVLPGLHAVGFDMASEPVVRAARWLIEHQNPDGGWGETCSSYVDRAARGRGPSTASQTAWALLALQTVAAPLADLQGSLQRGLAWLTAQQHADGSWEELEFTGTGFPGYGTGARPTSDEQARRALGQDESLQRAFMIRYSLYRQYFPLMALARARAPRG